MPAGQRRKPLDQLDWIAPDESMPDHPSVRWRRRHLPKVVPRHLMGSILGVVQAVEAGLGVAAVPLAMLAVTPQLVQLGDPLPGCESDLWLLAHPESRHLRRIAAVYDHFANHLHVV
jgi:DNA-binding transcriptional LysR family regulator